MKVLLDTCSVLWSSLSPASLSLRAREIVAEPNNEILVSAASAWEISTKLRLGKLPGAERLDQQFLELMEAAGYTLLAIEVEAALRAGRMISAHRDPFDRMLAAQAVGLDIPILSPDAQLDQLGARRVW